MVCKFFLPILDCLFILLIVSFAVQILLSLIWSLVDFCVLSFVVFGVIFKKIIAKTSVKEILPTFFSRSFIISGQMFDPF